MIEWFAVRTRAHAECLAAEHLRRQGYATYLPMQRLWVSHARQRKMSRRPLFPRYLFVGLECSVAPWRPILSTVGVVDLVRGGDDPIAVAPEVIESLRMREAEGAFDYLTATQRFKAGDAVRIAEGPFEDCIGRLVETSDEERVCILFEILGRPVRARLSSKALEAA